MEKKGARFTPRERIGGKWVRHEMRISFTDEEHFEDGKDQDWTEMTDLITGKKYLAIGASCGLGCKCDAIVKPATAKGHMEEITMHVFLDSEGDWQYDIYEGPPEAAEKGESLDGGACTTTMRNAIDMAADQAKKLV
jgi:hypothetical protein